MPRILTKEIAAEVTETGGTLPEMSFRRIETVGPWANAAFELMLAEFSPEVLDPKERLEGWLLDTQNGIHEFPFLWTVASIEHAGEHYIVGVFDGNLMPLLDWDRRDENFRAPLRTDGSCVFVVGRQATSAWIRQANIRGVGKALFEFSTRAAQNMAGNQERHIRYFVLESEERAKIFWGKMGFLWPENSVYWQPPLEFDESTGEPLYEPVQEYLMFKPSSRESGESIPAALVHATIATIFSNWSIGPLRQSLRDTGPALRVAEENVLGNLLQVCADSLPKSETIKLVPLPD